jgi:hypothetical protein
MSKTDNEREAAILRKLLVNPRVCVEIHPIFLLMLAMAIPDIIHECDIPDVVGCLRREGLGLMEQIRGILPDNIMRDLLNTAINKFYKTL